MSDKRPTSMSLDRALLDEAKSLGLNLSRAAEAGIEAAIRSERARVWQHENAAGIAEYNARIAAQGLPLAAQRKFR